MGAGNNYPESATVSIDGEHRSASLRYPTDGKYDVDIQANSKKGLLEIATYLHRKKQIIPEKSIFVAAGNVVCDHESHAVKSDEVAALLNGMVTDAFTDGLFTREEAKKFRAAQEMITAALADNRFDETEMQSIRSLLAPTPLRR